MIRVGACLSLTGRHSRFGRQAAAGLAAWRALRGPKIDLRIEDDGSHPDRLRAGLRTLAPRCELVLGPYSTGLAAAAAAAAADLGCLIWNHGGAGDHAQAAAPGRVVSVLTPASRYANPFLRRLTGRCSRGPLWIAEGEGGFSRQVAAGAESAARRLGLAAVRIAPGTRLRALGPPPAWDLLCAGSFEEDVAALRTARALRPPPDTTCAIAAGVADFAGAVAGPEGVHGIAQWFAGAALTPALGPPEADFLAAYARLTGRAPDYPAVQAAAAAVLAAHCLDVAGSAEPGALWAVASGLDTSTFFGGFRIDPASGRQVGHETVLVRWVRRAGEVRRELCRPP